MQSLLAYLLLHCDVPQSRAYLSFTFWPDSSDSQARTNLRREMLQLRRLLPQLEHYLRTESQTIQWNPEAAYSLDVDDFAAALAAAEVALDAQQRAELLQKAAALYQGPFLPGLYDEWVLDKREELSQQYGRALEQLTVFHAALRNYEAAIVAAQRLLRHDPLNEITYHRLMEYYAHQNDRVRALHTYHICATTLERELGIEPGAEVQRLYEQLYAMEANGEAKTAYTKAALTQLVGRTHEWQVLLKTWRRASAGRAHFVLIAGEAGIGKTRLSEELLEWVQRQGLPTARARAYAAEGSLAYAPIVEWLRSDALAAGVAELNSVWQAELARLLPDLLNSGSTLPHLAPLTERWQRQRLFEALARAVTADQQPKLLLIDDLQWCDQETLEWLHFLLRFGAALPLLVVGTVRSGDIATDHTLQALMHELERSEQVTSIPLSGFNREETETLATRVSGQPLRQQEAERLFTASEGNPLFVVEMVQAGYHRQQANDDAEADRATPLVSSAYLPPKVHAVIQARLTQLSPTARALASLAATIGHAFDFHVLVAASEDNEAVVASGLDELWRRRIVREQSANRYDFSHDRIRDVAYSEISPIQRRILHRRVAEALERIHADELDIVGGELARHYECAGLTARAVVWCERAAQAAWILNSLSESIKQCRSGLKLLQSLPASAERKRRELRLLLALGRSTSAAKGLAVPEYEEVLLGARELAIDIHDVDSRFAVECTLIDVAIVTGRTKQASVIAREILLFARETQNPVYLAAALWENGWVAQRLGHFDHSSAALEQAISLFDDDAVSPGDVQLVTDQRWVHLCLAINRWLMGYPDQALADVRRTMAYPQSRFSPYNFNMFSFTNALFLSSLLYRNVGAHELLATHIEQMLSFGAKYDLPLSQQSGKVFRGWQLAHQNRLTEGIESTRHGVDGFRAMGHTLFQTHRLAMLAEMLLWANQLEEAASVLREAFDVSEQASEHFWDVELHRLQGDLLLARDGLHDEAEQSYQRAIELAVQHHAKSLELRATIAFCRLWQHQGKAEQARQRLVALYGWFSEGFDTHDLRVSRALLDQLR